MSSLCGYISSASRAWIGTGRSSTPSATSTPGRSISPASVTAIVPAATVRSTASPSCSKTISIPPTSLPPRAPSRWPNPSRRATPSSPPGCAQPEPSSWARPISPNSPTTWPTICPPDIVPSADTCSTPIIPPWRRTAMAGRLSRRADRAPVREPRSPPAWSRSPSAARPQDPS